MTGLSLVLPCFNEAGRLPATLAAYLAHLPRGQGAAEIDDGSTDATAEVAHAAAAGDPRVRVLRSSPNRGKGFAVRTGMLAAAGDLLAFTDADGAYEPVDLERVVQALDHAPVAIGRRGPDTAAPLTRQLASRTFNQALHLLSDLPSPTPSAASRASAAKPRSSCSAAPGLTGSPSTWSCCCWPGGSASPSPRSRSGSGPAPAAGCGCWPTAGACSATSGRSAATSASAAPQGPMCSRQARTIVVLAPILIAVLLMVVVSGLA